eukprot:scaffold197122_cov20-Tisochrysis_lutea.AAC.2
MFCQYFAQPVHLQRCRAAVPASRRQLQYGQCQGKCRSCWQNLCVCNQLIMMWADPNEEREEQQ